MAPRILDLRIFGVTNRDLHRWRRLPPAKIAPGIVLILAIPLLTALIQDPSIEVGGRQVAGGRILLVQDKSGSMTEQQATVDRRLGALRAAGIFSGVACELSNNEFPDFSACVQKLSHRTDIDGLYVFADFFWDWNGSGYTCFPQPGDGTRRIVETLERTGWRVYLETIGCALPRDLAELAESSGGGVIHTRPK
jgi:hypothetical protein